MTSSSKRPARTLEPGERVVVKTSRQKGPWRQRAGATGTRCAVSGRAGAVRRHGGCSGSTMRPGQGRRREAADVLNGRRRRATMTSRFERRRSGRVLFWLPQAVRSCRSSLPGNVRSAGSGCGSERGIEGLVAGWWAAVAGRKRGDAVRRAPALSTSTGPNPRKRSLDVLQEQLGELPETRAQRTGGGRHLLYRAGGELSQSTGRLDRPAGVDVRCGYRG